MHASCLGALPRPVLSADWPGAGMCGAVLPHAGQRAARGRKLCVRGGGGGVHGQGKWHAAGSAQRLIACMAWRCAYRVEGRGALIYLHGGVLRAEGRGGAFSSTCMHAPPPPNASSVMRKPCVGRLLAGCSPEVLPCPCMCARPPHPTPRSLTAALPCPPRIRLLACSARCSWHCIGEGGKGAVSREAARAALAFVAMPMRPPARQARDAWLDTVGAWLARTRTACKAPGRLTGRAALS